MESSIVEASDWWSVEELPELPADMPRPNVGPGASLRAWAAVSPDGAYELFGALAGDCGAEGAYGAAVYVVPFGWAEPTERAEPAPPRFPTFEEWTAFLEAACLGGAMMSCMYVTGSDLIEPPSGWRVLLLGCVGLVTESPAGRRALLATLQGGLIHG